MEPVKIILYTDESRIAAILEQLGRLNLGPAGRIEVGDETNGGNGAETDDPEWRARRDAYRKQFEDPGMTWDQKLERLRHDAKIPD